MHTCVVATQENGQAEAQKDRPGGHAGPLLGSTGLEAKPSYPRLWGPTPGKHPLPPWDQVHRHHPDSRFWRPPRDPTAVISESIRKSEKECVSHSVLTDSL